MNQECVWVVIFHDQYENASMVESAWTDEAEARRHCKEKNTGHDVSGREILLSGCRVERVRLNTPAGYE